MVIVTSFPTNVDSPKGGVEAVSVNLIKALALYDDLELHVVTTDLFISRVQKYKWHGAYIHRLPRPQMSTLLYAVMTGRRQVSNYIKALFPDVVHSQDTYGIMVKGIAIPSVFTVHGFIYVDTLASHYKWAPIRSFLWRKVELAGWKDKDRILSITPYVRDRLEKVVDARIYDINNPVSCDFFETVHKEKRNTIFSSAVISPLKNTISLIKAFFLLLEEGVEASLRLAGEAKNSEYYEKVLCLIQKSHFSDSVILLGNISHSEVKKELSAASVYVLVSLEENAPMGIEEAMAVGVPVVASNRCGMPYMIKDEESGLLVDPTNVRDIALKLKRVIQDDQLRSCMGKESKKIAKALFHPNKIAEKTRAVYYDVINERSLTMK